MGQHRGISFCVHALPNLVSMAMQLDSHILPLQFPKKLRVLRLKFGYGYKEEATQHVLFLSPRLLLTSR